MLTLCWNYNILYICIFIQLIYLFITFLNVATRKYKNTYVIHIYKRNQSDSLKLGRGFIAIIAIYVCVCLGSP